jgi:hypothetical protein
MTAIFRNKFARFGLAAAIIAGTAAPALADPLWGHRGGYYDDYGYQAQYHGRGYDVAPVVRTPRAPYYAYNRYSGQVYGSCVIDLGYGRTQPCDAGGAGR